jgi:hypothetical protein
VRDSIEGISLAPDNSVLFPDEEAKKPKYWQQVRDNSLRTAEIIIESLIAANPNERVLSAIYVESSEKLDSLEAFKDDVILLSTIIREQKSHKDVLTQFYQTGKNPYL